jgi:CBS domain-containing protein
MRELRHCQCKVITSAPDAPVVNIADLMDRHSVGCVVVVDGSGKPLGIVTDRDLVSRVVAAGREAEKTTAGEVMSADLFSVDAREPLAQVLEQMRERGVRRVPVLEAGRVTGIASLDDILFSIATDIWNIAETVRIELRDAQRTVRRRRWNEQRRDAIDHIGSQAVDLARAVRGFAGRELEHLVGSFRKPR